MKLGKLFGPSEAEIWGQVAEAVGGQVIDGGFWKGKKLEAKAGEWTVTFDNYTIIVNKVPITYTRIRAPYLNRDKFRFTVFRTNAFTGIGKFFGMQDIEIGDPEFDQAFDVRSNEEAAARALLGDAALRAQFHAQPDISLTVQDDNGMFGGPFPAEADMLYFYSGYITDPERLKSLYALFAATLNRLTEIGSAYEDAPNVTL